MNPSKKRDFLIVVGMVAVFVLGGVYYQIYTSPALRYGHELYLLKCSTDTMREYQTARTQTRSIRIVEEGDRTEITFCQARHTAGSEKRFLITETNHTLQVFDEEAVAVLTGTWRGDCLYDLEGSKNALYASFLSKQRQFYLSDTYQPHAADAVFIYKTYPTSKRGKRGPLIFVGLFCLTGILLGEIDNPVTLDSFPFREGVRYEKTVSSSREGEERSQSMKRHQTGAVWVVALAGLIGVMLLIGDLFSY